MSDLTPPGATPPPTPGESSGPPANVGAALSWAFDTFKRNLTGFIALAAVVTIVQLVQALSSRPLQNIVTDCADPQTSGQINACAAALGVSAVVAIVISLVFMVIVFIAQLGIIRAGLRATQGQPPSFAEMFTTQHLGKFILLVLVYAVVFVVGIALCILPGLIAMFLLQLGPYYVLDKGYGVGDAIKSSVRVVTKNLGPALIMTIINALVMILGGMFYGILTLVTLPFATLFTAHMYRQFNREPIV